MQRALRLTIDRSAIQANWCWLGERAGVPAGAAVKADGYGLGAREVTDVLAEAGGRKPRRSPRGGRGRHPDRPELRREALSQLGRAGRAMESVRRQPSMRRD